MTKEDLAAIGALLDEKLDEKLRPIEDRLTAIEERMTAIEERMTVLEERVTAIEERMTVLEERVTAIEERVTAIEERVTAIEERMSTLEMRVSNVEISLENETNRHIRLIAENHIDLNRKLNEAIRVQDNSMMLEVEMSGYKSRLDRMERELHELKEKIA